jgi:O-antigen/teichoic acid export membrane protein
VKRVEVMILEKVISSSLIQVNGNMLIKAIGIISTAILARILSPADFGIIAMAVVVYEVLLPIGEIGTRNFILKQEKITDAIYNVTFTFRFICISLVTILLLFSVENIASYYQNNNVTEVLYVYALCLILKSLQNIYLLDLMREMNYKPILLVNLASKVLSVIFLIGFAFYFKDYRALAYGMLMVVIFEVIGSYIVSKKRPAFSLKGIRDNWNFSKWLLFEIVVGQMREKIDIIITGRFFQPSDLGYYQVGKNIGSLPMQQISNPISGICLSIFSQKNQNGSVEKTDNFEKGFIVMALIMTPLFIGFSLFMDIFVSVIIGEKWLIALPIFHAFLGFGFMGCFTMLVSSCFIANNLVKQLVTLNTLISIILIALIYFVASNGAEIEQIALVRFLFTIFAISTTLIFLKFKLKVQISHFLIAFLLYFSLGGLCLLPTYMLFDWVLTSNKYLTLCVTALFGIPSYFILTRKCSALLSNKISTFNASVVILDYIVGILTKRIRR